MESVNEINSLAAAGFELNAIIGRVANERHPPLPPKQNNAYYVCIDTVSVEESAGDDGVISAGEKLPCIPIVLNFEDHRYLSQLDDGVFRSIIFDWSVIDKFRLELRLLLKMWYRLLAWQGKLWIRGLHRGGGVNVGKFLTDRKGLSAREASLLLHEEQYKTFGDILLRVGTEVGFTTFARGRIKDGGYPIANSESDRYSDQAYYVLIKE